jgi:tetratricopeptide (TPR) repeat protein
MTMLTAIGELDRAVELAKQELALDPLSPFAHRQLAEQLYYAGQLDEAQAVANQAEKLGLGVATFLTMINFAQQDLDGVEAQLQRGDEAWGNGLAFRELFRLGYAFLNEDYVDSFVYWARIRFLPAHQSARTQQILNVLVGDYDTAFDYLEELAVSADFFVVRNIRGTALQRATNPEYYAHPRYQEILELVSLDDASIARLTLPE